MFVYISISLNFYSVQHACLNINFTIVNHMPLDDKTKEKIISSFSRFSIIQEYKILEKMKKCSFTKEEIEKIITSSIKEEISSDKKNKAINYLLKEFNPNVNRFYYESTDKRSGIEIKKIREIDFKFSFIILEKLESSANKTEFFFAGDIKNNDEYLWVFSSIIEKFQLFPIYFEDDPYKKNLRFPRMADPFFFEDYINKLILKPSPIVWKNEIPLPFVVAENMITLYTDGKKIEGKNGKKKEQLPRDFCNQVASGIEGLNLTIQRLIDNERVNNRNIIVPMIILSNKPLLISKIPPEKKDIQEIEALIYLFQPTFPLTTVKRWHIPILVVHQDSLLDVIKKLTVIFTIKLI